MKLRTTGGGRLLIGAVAVLCAGALARSIWEQSREQLPRIQVPSVTDMGRIPEGASAVAEIAVSNRGGAPLEIYEVGAPCSCLDLAIDDKVVPAGKSTVLRVVARGGGASSEAVAITIRSNDPRHATVSTVVRYDTGPGVSISPPLIALGTVTRGALPVTARIEVEESVGRRPSAPAMNPTANSASAWIRILPVACSSTTSAAFDVELTGAAPSGVLDTMVAIRLRQDEIAFQVPVQATIVGPIRAVPQRLTVHHVDVEDRRADRPRVQFIHRGAPEASCRVVASTLDGKIARLLELEAADDPAILRLRPRVARLDDSPREVGDLPEPVAGTLLATIECAGGSALEKVMVPVMYFGARHRSR